MKNSWIFMMMASLLGIVACAGRSPAKACAAEADWKPHGSYERCLEVKAAEFEALERRSRAVSSFERRERSGRRDLW